MALFTDGPDLEHRGSDGAGHAALGVASVEGIDVTQKLALAQEEIALELEQLLTRLSYDGAVDLGPRRRRIWRGGGDTGAEALAHLSDAGDGLRRCVQQPTERPVRGEARPIPGDGEVGVREAGRDRGRDRIVTRCAKAATPDGNGGAGEAAGGRDLLRDDGVGEQRRAKRGPVRSRHHHDSGDARFAVQPGTAPPSATGWNVYAGTAPDDLCCRTTRRSGPGHDVGAAGRVGDGRASAGTRDRRRAT